MEKLTCKKVVESLVIESDDFKEEISVKEALDHKIIKKMDKNHVVEFNEGGYIKIADPKNIEVRYKHLGNLIEKKTCCEFIAELEVDDSWEDDEISVLDAMEAKIIGKMDRNNIIEYGEDGFVQLVDPENIAIRYRRFSSFVEKMSCRDLIGELDRAQFLDEDKLSVSTA